jgi:hypothetical protein
LNPLFFASAVIPQYSSEHPIADKWMEKSTGYLSKAMSKNKRAAKIAIRNFIIS